MCESSADAQGEGENKRRIEMVMVTMHIGGFSFATEVEINAHTVSACLSADAMLRSSVGWNNNPEGVDFSVGFYTFVGGEWTQCKYDLQDKLVVLEGEHKGRSCHVIYQLTHWAEN